jgi:O-antigen/teichoic acid export membrane protein
VREVARDRSRAGSQTAGVLACKLAMAVPALALAAGIVALAGYPPQTRTVVYVLLLGLLLESLGRTAQHVFTAFERADRASAGIVIQRALTAAVGIGALASGLGVVAVAWAYALGALAGVLVSFALLPRLVPLSSFQLRRAEARELLRTASFAVQDFATLLLFRLDALILSIMAATAVVGRYGAAYRIFESTWFITVAISSAFLAMFTYLDASTEPTLRTAFQRSLKLSVATLGPCATGAALAAPAIVGAIFDDALLSAAPSLEILAPAIVLLGVATMSTSLLMSQRRPRPVLAASAGAVLINVVLNVALIPHLDARGSAVAMLVTEAFLAVVATVIVARFLGGLAWWSVAAGPLAACAAMGVVVLALGRTLGALVAGVAAYGLALAAIEWMRDPGGVRRVAGSLRRRLPA